MDQKRLDRYRFIIEFSTTESPEAVNNVLWRTQDYVMESLDDASTGWAKWEQV